MDISTNSTQLHNALMLIDDVRGTDSAVDTLVYATRIIEAQRSAYHRGYLDGTHRSELKPDDLSNRSKLSEDRIRIQQVVAGFIDQIPETVSSEDLAKALDDVVKKLRGYKL